MMLKIVIYAIAFLIALLCIAVILWSLITWDAGLTLNINPTVEAQTNIPPTISAAVSPNKGAVPLRVFFAATAQDLDGAIIGYSWDFGDNSVSSSQDPSHTYQNAGIYAAIVTVTDNEGATAQYQIVIAVTVPSPPQPPKIILIKSADKTQAVKGDTITYTIQYQNVGLGDAVNTTIKDQISQGTTYVHSSATDSPNVSSNTLTWTIPRIPAGGQGSVSFKVAVN